MVLLFLCYLIRSQICLVTINLPEKETPLSRVVFNAINSSKTESLNSDEFLESPNEPYSHHQYFNHRIQHIDPSSIDPSFIENPPDVFWKNLYPISPSQHIFLVKSKSRCKNEERFNLELHTYNPEDLENADLDEVYIPEKEITNLILFKIVTDNLNNQDKEKNNEIIKQKFSNIIDLLLSALKTALDNSNMLPLEFVEKLEKMQLYEVFLHCLKKIKTEPIL